MSPNTANGGLGEPKRVTVRLQRETLDSLDQLVDDGEYANRSQAIRAFIEDGLDHHVGQLALADGGEV